MEGDVTMRFVRRCLVTASYVLVFLGSAQALSPAFAATTPHRYLYAVDEDPGSMAWISIYDMDNGHVRTNKFLPTGAYPPVTNVSNLRGVVADAASARLYVSYEQKVNNITTGWVYAMNLYNNKLVWNKEISPGVDRLAISPNGQTLYVPSGEGLNYSDMNVVNATDGSVIKELTTLPHRPHDALFSPTPTGQVFQECKATDGTCEYLYEINPSTFTVTKLPEHFPSYLGPFAPDHAGRYVVANVNGLYAIAVADLSNPSTPVSVTGYPGRVENCAPCLTHGIAWKPDQTQVWQADRTNKDIVIWNMANPMKPTGSYLPLYSGSNGSHWISFSIRGDYAYVSPTKLAPPWNGSVEVFKTGTTNTEAALLEASDDLLEIDFTGAVVTAVGNQFGIGRK
jgi:hypothetical protein